MVRVIYGYLEISCMLHVCAVFFAPLHAIHEKYHHGICTSTNLIPLTPFVDGRNPCTSWGLVLYENLRRRIATIRWRVPAFLNHPSIFYNSWPFLPTSLSQMMGFFTKQYIVLPVLPVQELSIKLATPKTHENETFLRFLKISVRDFWKKKVNPWNRLKQGIFMGMPFGMTFRGVKKGHFPGLDLCKLLILYSWDNLPPSTVVIWIPDVRTMLCCNSFAIFNGLGPNAGSHVGMNGILTILLGMATKPSNMIYLP